MFFDNVQISLMMIWCLAGTIWGKLLDIIENSSRGADLDLAALTSSSLKATLNGQATRLWRNSSKFPFRQFPQMSGCLFRFLINGTLKTTQQWWLTFSSLVSVIWLETNQFLDKSVGIPVFLTQNFWPRFRSAALNLSVNDEGKGRGRGGGGWRWKLLWKELISDFATKLPRVSSMGPSQESRNMF